MESCAYAKNSESSEEDEEEVEVEEDNGTGGVDLTMTFVRAGTCESCKRVSMLDDDCSVCDEHKFTHMSEEKMDRLLRMLNKDSSRELKQIPIWEIEDGYTSYQIHRNYDEAHYNWSEGSSESTYTKIYSDEESMADSYIEQFERLTMCYRCNLVLNVGDRCLVCNSPGYRPILEPHRPGLLSMYEQERENTEFLTEIFEEAQTRIDYDDRKSWNIAGQRWKFELAQFMYMRFQVRTLLDFLNGFSAVYDYLQNRAVSPFRFIITSQFWAVVFEVCKERFENIARPLTVVRGEFVFAEQRVEASRADHSVSEILSLALGVPTVALMIEWKISVPYPQWASLEAEYLSGGYGVNTPLELMCGLFHITHRHGHVFHPSLISRIYTLCKEELEFSGRWFTVLGRKFVPEETRLTRSSRKRASDRRRVW